jgi:hypothetical protein
VFGRALVILLALTLAAALPAAAQASAAKPGAAHAAKKKPKKHKKKKKAKKVVTKLWYRVTVDGTSARTDGFPQGGGIVQRSTWRAPSRAAVILKREPAPSSPTNPGPIRDQFAFAAGVGGPILAAQRLISGVPSPNQCPTTSQSVVQDTAGSVNGTISGALRAGAGGGGRISFPVSSYQGTGTETVQPGGCTGPPFTRRAAAPGAWVCPPEAPFTVSGSVSWGGEFTIHATCSHKSVAWWGASTLIESTMDLTFKPCPGRGTRVARC